MATAGSAATGAAPGTAGAGVIGIVVKGWPRLSETFIAQELLALEQRGFALALFSLRRPTDAAVHPTHAALEAPVRYLPEYLHDDAGRVWRAWRSVRRLEGYRAMRAAFLRDLWRDPSRSRVRRFGQALVLAAELPREVAHLHAHFLHTPGSVARYAAIARGLRWSVFAHAKDIWTIPEWEKREKLEGCAFAATCTSYNAEHLRALAGARAVELVYHGIDTARFPPPSAVMRARDGRDPRAPVTVLCVGRAVDKKGLDDLLEALAAVPAALHWRLVHVGGGPLLPLLARRARELRIDRRVEWRGAQPHARVLEAYRAADVFVLPSRISADGDRDGLPNVLLEAQSQRLPCISTRVAGIPELIVDGVTGVLVEPRTPAALAHALATLMAQPQLRRRLGDAGYARTTGAFSMHAGVDHLARRLAACLQPS
jgi:glycosyltransferase involved in cell wall biosynthesis